MASVMPALEPDRLLQPIDGSSVRLEWWFALDLAPLL
jgi:hypothetical protein